MTGRPQVFKFDTYTPTSLTDSQISVTITGDGVCIASDNLNLTIYDLPIVNLSIDDNDLCMGDSIVVSSNSGYDNYMDTLKFLVTRMSIPTSSLDMIYLT